jgi:hypothetical protein
LISVLNQFLSVWDILGKTEINLFCCNDMV